VVSALNVNNAQAIIASPELRLTYISNSFDQGDASGFLLDGQRVGPRRTLSMPGLSATVGEQIEALRRVAGEQAVRLIRREPDESIMRIVETWAPALEATRALRARILEFRAAGHCILFSSHVMQEVAALCDDIVIVDHGRVAAAGTPEALKARFASATLEDAFVAAIGDARGLE
jgi:hypothetical protein